MAGLPCITAEITIPGGGTIYACTHTYYTAAADTPASTLFESRIADDVSFDRSVGCVFWGSSPRGAQNFGRIRLVNADGADGAYDTHVGKSFRDQAVTIKRGETGDAYSTFTTVAVLVVEAAEMDERYFDFTVKDRGARLEKSLQASLYPTTVTNQALRGKPRPISLGTCHQVPVQQPDVFGNGHYDIHEDEQWIGITQWLDQGAALIEGTGYRRSAKTGIYGVERLTALGGAQVANLQGRWRELSLELSDDFTSLAGWTELSGGVAGRDASIVGNELSMVNTLGGADLLLQSTTSITAAASDIFWYEIDCTQWTSGSVQLRTGSSAFNTERTIDGLGRYTGVFRAASNFNLRIYAVNGSNASLQLDNLRIRKIALADRLQDIVPYLVTTKGPLLSGEVDSTAIAQLDTDTGYRYGFHAAEPIQIADVLDQLAISIGGWWYVKRDGVLTMGRLLAPKGTASYTFNDSNIKRDSGVRVVFDAAPGLSNVVLAKRNFSVLSESVDALTYVQLNPSDKDADVGLSNSNYTYSAANAGSVRSTPGIYGERYYFEITVAAVGAASQHYIGVGNASAAIGSYPGSDTAALSYRADGNRYTNGTATAFGSTWTTADVIGVAIDGRPAAMGANQQHVRVYFRKNGTWQGSANPDTEAAFLPFTGTIEGVAHLMLGGNAAETNAGVVNFGQSAFAATPPADYSAHAWQRQTLLADYRFKYRSTTTLAAAYAHADNAPALTGRTDNERQFAGGIGTLLSKEADAIAECNRWATLYSQERFTYQFTALIDAGVNADQIEPGDLIEITWPRFGLSAKKLRVIGVAGQLLGREVRITAWG